MRTLILGIILSAGLTLPGSAAPNDLFVPWLRLWQQPAVLTAPPCSPEVATAPVANYVMAGESKYRLDFMTANASGTICLNVWVNGQIVQRTCQPTCNASPCTLWAPVVGPPGTAEELTVSLSGEGPPACVFPALAWDFQLVTGP